MDGVLGIDPGLKGAFVLIAGGAFSFKTMPLEDGRVSFEGVGSILKEMRGSTIRVYLERAMPLAMGARHAFNYGRDFAALELSIKLARMPVVYVEPQKWGKAMMEGVDARLKPKERAQIAVKRLFPEFISSIPSNRNGKLHEGVVDALLLAGYGKLKEYPIRKDDF